MTDFELFIKIYHMSIGEFLLLAEHYYTDLEEYSDKYSDLLDEGIKDSKFNSLYDIVYIARETENLSKRKYYQLPVSLREVCKTIDYNILSEKDLEEIAEKLGIELAKKSLSDAKILSDSIKEYKKFYHIKQEKPDQ